MGPIAKKTLSPCNIVISGKFLWLLALCVETQTDHGKTFILAKSIIGCL